MAQVSRRVAIVGGVAGMGFAAAEILAREGASIAIIGRDPVKAEAKAARLAGETGARVLGLIVDRDAPHSSASAIDRAAAAFGGLDGVAITAGPMGRQAPFLELEDADWRETFETQLMTVVRAARAALPYLLETRGSLVTTAAYSVRCQKAQLSSYAALKSAIVSVTKNIAKTYGAHGVRANCVAPGAVATDAMDEIKDAAVAKYGLPVDAALNRMMVDDYGMKVAQNRVGQPHEVGELIAFLLSDKAAFMTGALINIDGGTDF